MKIMRRMISQRLKIISYQRTDNLRPHAISASDKNAVDNGHLPTVVKTVVEKRRAPGKDHLYPGPLGWFIAVQLVPS